MIDDPRFSWLLRDKWDKQSVQLTYTGMCGGWPAAKPEPVTAMQVDTTWNGYVKDDDKNYWKNKDKKWMHQMFKVFLPQQSF